MSFFARTFIFDGVPSETYGLFINTPDGGDSSSPAGSGVEPILEEIYRRPKPYFYGVKQSPVLSFPIEIYSENLIDMDRSTVIERWLFGQMNYKKLIIVQNDIQLVYYNCFLMNPEKKIIGNQVSGYVCEVQCDSPWGLTNYKTKTYNYTTDNISETYTFNIQTDNNYYTFPTVEFTVGTNKNLTIRNTSDSNRDFIFGDSSSGNLIPGETITVNNDLGIITSTSGLLRLPNFNKNLFRFVRGKNILQVNGSITMLRFIYQLAKKTGG